MPETNIALLVNCHRVEIDADRARRALTQWLANVIREAAPDAMVQADLAAAVIDILPPKEGGLHSIVVRRE